MIIDSADLKKDNLFKQWSSDMVYQLSDTFSEKMESIIVTNGISSQDL